MIDCAALKELLHYEPATGVFTWKKPRAHRCKVGDVAGYGEPGRYIRINLADGIYYAHRLAYLYMTGAWAENDVDHVNGDRHDNSWSNLRPANRSENLSNSAKTKSISGFRGVFKRGQKFCAKVTRNKKQFFVGTFDTAEEAATARNKAAQRIHGEFFPQSLKQEKIHG